MENITEKSGSLTISKEVIESIAKYTINEMNGISIAPKTTVNTGWLFEQKTLKPVSIELTDGIAIVDARIIVNSDINIPIISKQLQSAIKESVQNMTSVVVSKVNIHIAGINFDNNKD